MHPIRIIARLTEPIVTYGDGLHLDGVLGLGAYAEHRSLGLPALPPLIGATVPEDFDLGLARVEAEGAPWIWHCSAARADWTLQGIMERRRPAPTDHLTRWTTAKRVDVATGRFKPWDLRFPTIFAHELEWRAVGDRARVQHLLGFVRGLGKHVAAGGGWVESWCVEPVAEDLALVQDGAAMRNLPLPIAERLGVRGSKRVASCRVPYWHYSRRCICVCPEPPEVRT